MFNSSIKHKIQHKGLRFFNAISAQEPQILYASIESGQQLTGLYHSANLARQLAAKTPGISTPVALARLMRHDMLKHIEKTMEWAQKVYPNEKNLVTIITTPEGMYNTPPGEEFMLTQTIFQEELILPLQQFMRQQPTTTGIHFGTFGVLVKPNDSNFKPADYRIIETENLVGIKIRKNIPPITSSHQFMNAAIYGFGGTRASVDYYTKKNVWINDNYKDQYLQLYDTTKPNIVIHENFARVLRICLDCQYDLTAEEMENLCMQIGMHTLPEQGVDEIMSYSGALPEADKSIYDVVFVSEGKLSNRSGLYDMSTENTNELRNQSSKREFLQIDGEKWPVQAKLYLYAPTALGKRIVLKPETGVMEKFKNSLLSSLNKVTRVL